MGSKEQLGAREPERISSAAVQWGEKLFFGVNHTEAIDKLYEKYPDWEKSGGPVAEGFFTSRGRFITDGKEITRIASSANQWRPGVNPKASRLGRPLSEEFQL